MTNAIDTLFQRLRRERRKAFIPFVTAGDPDPDGTARLVGELARRGAIPGFKKGRQWRFRKRDITLFKRQLKGLNAAA